MSANSKMRLDIIIPIYNCENNISNLLKELCIQNVYNDSIILIDDGSTDDSYNICKYYADRYTNIALIHQQNKGPALARNRGIDIGTNDFIWFIDSDDMIKENALEVIHSYLLYNTDILCFGMTMIGLDDNIEIYKNEQFFDKNKYNVYLGEIFNEIIDKSLFNSLCNKVFKREFLHKNNLYLDEVNLIEDVNYVIKVMSFYPTITAISDSLYIYHRIINCRNTVSSKYYLDKFDRYLELDDKFEELVNKYQLPRDSSKKINDILLCNIYSALVDEYSFASKISDYRNYNKIIKYLKNNSTFRMKLKDSKGVTFPLKVFRIFYLFFPISIVEIFVKIRVWIKSI